MVKVIYTAPKVTGRPGTENQAIIEQQLAPNTKHTHQTHHKHSWHIYMNTTSFSADQKR